MYAFCLLLSVIATALGVFALGFGFVNHDFSFGNTLIIAGATAVIGGMVLFGLAAAVRQLRRIADALVPRPGPAPRRQSPPEVAEAAPVQRPQPPAQRIPYPPRPGADQREVRFEQRPAAAPPAEAPEAPPAPSAAPMERPRPNIFGVARGAGDTPMVEDHEEVPLAPSRMPAPPVQRGAPPSLPEPPAEPRPTQTDIMARLSNLAAAPPRPAPPRPEPPRAPPPPVERPVAAEQRRPNMFDALWPADVRGARQSQPEAIARAPKPEVRAEARPEAKQEPRLDAKPDPRLDIRPEPRLEPKPDTRFEPPMARERAEPTVNGAAREPMMPPPAEPRPIAILKSGVIDGMAYTLYTDGSIEAELPQGTMRFASIEALRAHLEKAERQD